MISFEFNEFNVCLNPNRYVILSREKWATDYATIKTYYQDGKWKGGISVIFNRFGFSGTSDKGYESEKSCYESKKLELLEYLKRNIETESEKQILYNINERFNHFPEAIQLTLF